MSTISTEPTKAETKSESPQTYSAPRIERLFDRLVLGGPMPYLIVAITLGITAFFTFYIKNFQMDASNDSILLENDPDLRYYNTSREVFGTDDYVVVVVNTKSEEDLFSDRTLKFIG